MNDQEVSGAVSLALNPEQGRPFSFGGREFKFQFLTYDGEQKLVELLKPRVKEAVLGSHDPNGSMMALIRDLLPEAVTIILRDYGADIDLAWVRSVRGPRMSEAMYDLVAAQFQVNDLGNVLSASLHADALLQALTAPAEA